MGIHCGSERGGVFLPAVRLMAVATAIAAAIAPTVHPIGSGTGAMAAAEEEMGK